MDAKGLKASLHALNLIQADLAKLVGVTPRAVTLWTGGERPVPGAVAAYLQLLSSLPNNLRQAEMARLKKGLPTMPEGIYGMSFEISGASGTGLLIFEGGRIYGTDEAGVRYDGSYELNQRTVLIELRLRVTFPPGVQSVLGIKNTYEWSIDAEATVDPKRPNAGVRVRTSTGETLKAKFWFLRTLPGSV